MTQSDKEMDTQTLRKVDSKGKIQLQKFLLSSMPRGTYCRAAWAAEDDGDSGVGGRQRVCEHQEAGCGAPRCINERWAGLQTSNAPLAGLLEVKSLADR